MVSKNNQPTNFLFVSIFHNASILGLVILSIFYRQDDITIPILLTISILLHSISIGLLLKLSDAKSSKILFKLANYVIIFSFFINLHNIFLVNFNLKGMATMFLLYMPLGLYLHLLEEKFFYFVKFFESCGKISSRVIEKTNFS